MPVALVTDSTAYLPADLVERHRVMVVPLQVLMAGKAFDENEVRPEELARALRDRTPVTTSRPSPGAFAAAYAWAAENGYTAIVSIHLSGEMSGTYGSAVLAAHQSRIPVEVVDSRSLGLGLGFAVLAAARVRDGGETPRRWTQAAASSAANTVTCFYVDTLEHLRRGGRIGAASAVVGSALAIKPLLRLDDGRIVPLENVRTSVRAIARLEEIVVGLAPRAGAVQVAVHHLDAPERARELAARLTAALPGAPAALVVEIGAVVGAHVGPGCSPPLWPRVRRR